MRLLAAAWLAVSICQTAAAAGEGNLYGTVSVSGVPLPGARVEVRGPGISRVEWSARNGSWRIAGLPAGRTVTVIAESNGCVREEKELAVQEGEMAVDFRLSLTNMRETVVVTEGLLSVRSDAPEKSQTLTAEQLRNLPSNGRRLMRFSLLSPHVRQGIGLGGDGNDSDRLSINASSYRHTSYVLDGAVNYDWIYANGPQQTVSVGAVEQFKILSGQYAAEFGTSTAGVLVVATKSGTNNLHGEVVGFVRPSGIQAQAPLVAAGLPRVPNERFRGAPRLAGRLHAIARSSSSTMKVRGSGADHTYSRRRLHSFRASRMQSTRWQSWTIGPTAAGGSHGVPTGICSTATTSMIGWAASTSQASDARLVPSPGGPS